jgi:hypothetical protein
MGMMFDDNLDILDLDALRACSVCGDPFCPGCETPNRRRGADALRAHATALRDQAAGLPRFLRCRWLAAARKCELRARALMRPTRVDDDAA